MKIQTLGTRGLAWPISSAIKSGDYPRSPHFKQPIRVVSVGVVHMIRIHLLETLRYMKLA